MLRILASDESFSFQVHHIYIRIIREKKEIDEEKKRECVLVYMRTCARACVCVCVCAPVIIIFFHKNIYKNCTSIMRGLPLINDKFEDPTRILNEDLE